jgi:hypothetical protein
MMTFMQRVSGIVPEDWGARAKLRLYRLAPIIDRLRGSETKFLTIYEEPIEEERIKHDWGSGRYRLYLNMKTAGQQGERELDQVEFDILDMNFPPRVPAGEWVDDHRNKQWAWAKSFFPAPPGAAPVIAAPPVNPAGDFLAAMRVGTEIRKEIREELQPVVQSAAPAAPLVDPLTQAMGIAKEFMQMRSENPMVDILRDELKDMRAELRSEREENRKMQEEIRRGQNGTAAAPPKTFMEQLKEAKEIIGLISGGDGAAATVARAGKTSWLDFAREVVPQVVNSELLAGLGQRLAASATATTAPNPAMSPQQTAANGQADNSEAAYHKWIAEVVNKQVIRFFLHMPGMSGEDLADILYALEPEWTLRLQQFEHPQLPGLKGQDAILMGFQHTRSVWPQIQQSGRAAEFGRFVQEFCEWKPDEAEPMEGEPEDDGITDFSESETGGEA